MALTQKERSRKFYENRKNSGLCPRCGKILDRKGHYCFECKEKVNKNRKETRDFYRDNHICTTCGKQIVYGNDITCPECRAKRDKYRKPLNEDDKKKMNERSRYAYKKRIELNLCTKCGKRQPAPGKKKCILCLNYDAEIHRKRTYNKINIKDYRKENHLCYFCGKEIDRDTGKICQSCWEKCKEAGAKSSSDNNYWKNENKIVFKNV